jgi:CubicO group peptidase (beta-lactamase class C family)
VHAAARTRSIAWRAAALVFCCTLSFAHASERGAERIAWLTANLPALLAAHHVPGASVALLEDGASWAAAWGLRDARTREPVTTDTAFEAASLSKPVLALLALQFVQAGRLDLDRPLVGYLGHDYVPDQPAHRRITARMVLVHRSGFPNWRPGEDENGPLPLLFEPGTQDGYSGEGMLFLQRALEAIGGASLQALANDGLFTPLALQRTAFRWSEAIERDLASGHDAAGTFLARTRYAEPNGAYTLYTTPTEYARLVQTLLAPEVLGARAFTPASIELMLARRQRLDGHEFYRRPAGAQGSAAWRALGWSIESGPVGDILQHSGSNRSGFKAFVQFSRARRSALVLFTNGAGGGALRDAVVAAIGDP